MKGRHRHLLDTLFELQDLDRVPRLGYALRGVAQPESVSEHSFHLVFLVWALAAEEGELDRQRAMEIALVHDLAEVRLGDLPRTAVHYLPEGAKAAAESRALDDLLAPLGPRGVELHDEYVARQSPEARFVAICDKLQLLIKATVYASRGQDGVRQLRDGLLALDDGGFATIRRLLDELFQRGEAQHPPVPEAVAT